MKTIEKDELYENLRQFLKRKGVELGDGSYAQRIQNSCRILADAINMGQTGLERAKTGIGTKLDQVREAIHKKTAPKPRGTSTSCCAASPEAGTGASAATAAPPVIPAAAPPVKAPGRRKSAATKKPKVLPKAPGARRPKRT